MAVGGPTAGSEQRRLGGRLADDGQWLERTGAGLTGRRTVADDPIRAPNRNHGATTKW
jgi:hypothetical protein